MYFTIFTTFLAKRFSFFFALTFIFITLILTIASAFDILNNFKTVDFTPSVFWQLVSYKIPFIIGEIAGLIAFTAAMLFFYSFNSHNEMIIALASGVSIFRILLTPFCLAIIFGAFFLLLLNPLGTYGMRSFKALKEELNNDPQNTFIVYESGIFFFEKYGNENRVIRAGSINTANNELFDIVIIISDDNGNFLSRVDAKKAALIGGNFKIYKPKILTDSSEKTQKHLILPTRLSLIKLMQQFIPPEYIPIWEMPEIINNFNKSGFKTTSYQLFYYKQIFKPLMMAVLVLLACLFTSINDRDKKSLIKLSKGFVIGVVVYFAMEIIIRMLAFSGFSAVYATLLPIILVCIIINFAILHFYQA